MSKPHLPPAREARSAPARAHARLSPRSSTTVRAARRKGARTRPPLAPSCAAPPRLPLPCQPVRGSRALRLRPPHSSQIERPAPRYAAGSLDQRAARPANPAHVATTSLRQASSAPSAIAVAPLPAHPTPGTALVAASRYAQGAYAPAARPPLVPRLRPLRLLPRRSSHHRAATESRAGSPRT